MFSALYRLIIRRQNLEVVTKRLLHLKVKNTGVVLVPFRAWRCATTAISGGVDISEVPGFYFVTTDEFSARVTKISSKTGVS